VFASRAERHEHLRGFHFSCDCTQCTQEERREPRPLEVASQRSLRKALEGVAKGSTDAATLWRVCSKAVARGAEADASYSGSGLLSRATGALVAYFLSNLKVISPMGPTARTRPRQSGPPFDSRFVASILWHDLARRRRHFGDRALAQIGYVRVLLALLALDGVVTDSDGAAQALQKCDGLDKALFLCSGFSR